MVGPKSGDEKSGDEKSDARFKEVGSNPEQKPGEQLVGESSGGESSQSSQVPLSSQLDPNPKSYHAVMDVYRGGENFRAYEDRLKQYFKIVKCPEDEKVALFITVVGTESHNKLMSLTSPDLPSTKSLDELLCLLADHYADKVNKRAERFRFRNIVQQQGESIKEYVVRVQEAAQKCMFGDYLEKEVTTNFAKYKRLALEDELINQFIAEVRSFKIQQKLINDSVDVFQKCVETAINFEMTERESRNMHPERMVSSVVRKAYPQRQDPRTQCKRCNRFHDESTCPAKDWEFYICGKKGHTSRVCSQKRSNGHVSQVENPKNCIVNQPGQTESSQ